jgi:DNA-directed RNA polymerase specialized sigma24 family protein
LDPGRGMEAETPPREDVTAGLDRLWRDEGERLWRAVLAFAQDRSVADDAVAEAFAQCLARGSAVRDQAAWVRRAAFRIAAGQLQERRRFRNLSSVPTVDEPEPPGPLLACLRRLPTNQRAAIVLRYYVGCPTDEIARTLGTRRATVRVHLSRGRRRLRTLLEEADG